MNYQKQENENTNEQLSIFEKNYEKLDNENQRMLKIKDELIVNLDKVIKRIDTDNNTRATRNELVSILQVLLENSNSTALKNLSDNRSDISNDDRNLSQDDIYDNKNNMKSTKRGSYITQNYEKFKQSQAETKLINQSK